MEDDELKPGEIGLVESKGWLSEYIKSHTRWDILDRKPISTEDFPSIFPIAMRVAATTIGMDLVSVAPMSAPSGIPPHLEYSYGGMSSEDLVIITYKGSDKSTTIEVIFEHDTYYLKITSRQTGEYALEETNIPMGLLNIDPLINMFSGKSEFISLHRKNHIRSNLVFDKRSGFYTGIKIIRHDEDYGTGAIYEGIHYIDKECADNVTMMLQYFKATGEIKDVII